MAELLPSELPLIIKKELIKAEDRINKTRTPNVDQDVVGGMPTDKTDSTSIGETILDILCSQRFLSENKIAVQKIVDAISTNPDSQKVASEVLASVIDKKAVKAQNTANTAVTNAKTADDKAVKAQNTANTAVTNASTAQNRADSAYSLAEKKRDLNDTVIRDSRWPEVVLRANSVSGEGANIHLINDNSMFRVVYRDENSKDNMSIISFRKKSGDVALTSELNTKVDKSAITSNLGSSTTLVASQKLVSDISEVQVDQIFAFDTATPPKGYIARNGQAIDKNTMPKLYARYGANMPDDRDRVLRMAGPLAGTAGSTQEDAMQRITGEINQTDGYTMFWTGYPSATGAFKVENASALKANSATGKQTSVTSLSFDSSLSPGSRTSTETRVKSRIVILCNKIQ